MSKPAVPLDPLQQVMQTRSTRYDPGGPPGHPFLTKRDHLVAKTASWIVKLECVFAKDQRVGQASLKSGHLVGLQIDTNLGCMFCSCLASRLQKTFLQKVYGQQAKAGPGPSPGRALGGPRPYALRLAPYRERYFFQK